MHVGLAQVVDQVLGRLHQQVHALLLADHADIAHHGARRPGGRTGSPGPGRKVSIRGAERTTKTSSGAILPRRIAMSRKLPLVAIDTEAVAKVIRSQISMIW